LKAYGDHGQEGILGGFELAGSAALDDCDIAGLGVENQKIFLILRQREAIGPAADGHGSDAAPEIDIVDCNAVRAEVAGV
jgi:hypothetical protein